MPDWLRFNVLGILDLAVAIMIAVLAAVLGFSPSTEALGLLPLPLAPTVAVPLAIALHIVSLQRLRSATRPRSPSRSPPPGPAPDRTDPGRLRPGSRWTIRGCGHRMQEDGGRLCRWRFESATSTMLR